MTYGLLLSNKYYMTVIKHGAVKHWTVVFQSGTKALHFPKSLSPWPGEDICFCTIGCLEIVHIQIKAIIWTLACPNV